MGLLKASPYHIVYLEMPDTIRVLVVAHDGRCRPRIALDICIYICIVSCYDEFAGAGI